MSIKLIVGPTSTDFDKLDDDMYELIADADIHRANKNYIEALKLYQKAGTLGNLYAQRWAGQFYLEGLGIEKNYEKAIQWFRMGAEQNDPISITNVAIMYSEGYGVSKNDEKAIALFKRASNLGHAFASGQLGLAYELGKGVSISYEHAVCYYQLALSQGSKDSAFMNNLGLCYMDGKGIVRDYKRAEELFRNAISLGNKNAINNYDILKKRITKEKEEIRQQQAIAARKEKERKEKIWVCIIIAGIICFYLATQGIAVGFFMVVALIIGAVWLLRCFVENETEKEKRHRSQYCSGIKCIHCGSESVYRMNFDDKRSSIAFWGIASNKIGKTYHCDNCGNEW